MPDQRSEIYAGTTTVSGEGPDLEPENLVRENIGWMLALAERILHDRGLAEDAVQESFLNAFCGLNNFEGRSTLKTWLRKITVNTSLTRLRKLKRLAEQSIDELLPEFDRQDCRIEAPWSRLAEIEDVLERADLRAQIIENINSLPDSYRIVLQLRDIEEYDTKEVSALLEISETNVKVRLHRARTALKKKLEPIVRGDMVYGEIVRGESKT